MGDILAMVLAQGTVPVDVVTDPARLRPVDEPVLRGDNGRLRALTGWEPRIGMEQIVAELLAFWRVRIHEE
jgi:GDP-4-dehydro-6-deoxy-D-mannose reductase